MHYQNKSKEQLITEIKTLHQQVDDLKLLEKHYQQLEDELQESKRQLKTFMDLIPVAIFSKDLEGRYTSVNADTLTYWTKSPIGYTDAELLPEEVAHKLRAVDIQVMETAKEHYVEEQLLVDNELRTILSRKVPLRDTSNEIVGVLGISLNITEQKRAEEQRIQLEIERERIKLLSDFITQVSHEFRTPLTIIDTSTYLLSKIDPSEKLAKHLKKINEQADNLEILIQNMMTLAVIDSNKYLNPEKVNLDKILRYKHTELQDIDLDFQLELNDNPLWVIGNESYFEQAIGHILNNAIQHTPHGGNIIVRSSQTDKTAIIDIVDTGSGIDNRDVPYIFDRFYRADKAGSMPGFGLGLPIAKAILERFGGEVSVQSTSENRSHLRI